MFASILQTFRRIFPVSSTYLNLHVHHLGLLKLTASDLDTRVSWLYPGLLAFFLFSSQLFTHCGIFFSKLVSLPCPNLSFEHTLVDVQRSCYKDQSSKTNSKYLPFILSPSSLSINPCLNPPQSFFYNESTIARGRA